MSNCVKCQKEFYRDWRKDKKLIKREPVPRFCSIHCARSYGTFKDRIEINQKVSRKMSGQTYHGNLPSQEMVLLRTQKQRKTLDNKILSTPWHLLSFERRKRRVWLEQNGKCLLCGTSDVWNGLPLTFHYDHIDGKKTTEQDNRRENVRMICPNCHTQTPTYGPKGMSLENREKAGAFARRAQKVLNDKRIKCRRSIDSDALLL